MGINARRYDKMPKQMEITRYNPFQAKIVQINEWKQVDVLFIREIDFVLFHNFLEQRTIVS